MIIGGKLKRLGDIGEDMASKYLSEKGHRILERNWRAGHLEVDIISINSDGVHFVEVKSKTAPYDVQPEEKVNKIKQKRIERAALRYINEKSPSAEVFFGVLTVVFDRDKFEIHYFPQAYMPVYI